jgi:hypothetical protein
MDQHSLIADPLLVRGKNDTFRLRKESPAFSLGFQPLDLSRVGPRKEVLAELRR